MAEIRAKLGTYIVILKKPKRWIEERRCEPPHRKNNCASKVRQQVLNLNCVKQCGGRFVHEFVVRVVVVAFKRGADRCIFYEAI